MQDLRRPRRWPWYGVAAAVVVAVAAIGLAVSGGPDRPAFAGPPHPLPADAPAPGTVQPWVDSPPAWFGAGSVAERPSGFRTRWPIGASAGVAGPGLKVLLTMLYRLVGSPPSTVRCRQLKTTLLTNPKSPFMPTLGLRPELHAQRLWWNVLLCPPIVLPNAWL